MQDRGLKPTPRGDFDALFEKAFVVVLCAVLVTVLSQTWVLYGLLDELFIKASNDNILRLVSVRNWLGGQAWFDTVEYRLIPPEGVLLHWSRYIDAMIGGLIVIFSNFVPMDRAEIMAVSVWPSTLMVLQLLVVGFGARRLFGPAAASFAMLCVLTWPFTSQFYFRAGQVDHHNVQILMTVLMTLAVIWPNTPVRSGVIAGLSAAVALAIGLETLPYILLLGLLLFLRATFVVTPVASRLLGAFCVTMAVAAVSLWLGQTPPARLTSAVCDQLGLPVLSLIAIASAASLIPMAFAFPNSIIRLLVSLVIVAVGFAAAWSYLGPCVAGPYGSLPIEVQNIIRSTITEALPALSYARTNALLFIEMVVPAVVSLMVAGVILYRLDRTTDASRVTRDQVGQLLILSIVGIVGAFFQVRLFLMSAGAIPLLAGFVLSALLVTYLKGRSGSAAVNLMAACVLIIAPFVLNTVAKQIVPQRSQQSAALDRNCRDPQALEALNSLPPSVFLTTLNLGPAMLLATHHDVLAGPYHRSPDAFANGSLPFQLPEPEMRAYLERIGAEHLILCDGTNYGSSFATDLARGAQASWLRPVDLDAGDMLIFAIMSDGDA